MLVAVLGHRGMLGSVVARYFAQRVDVLTTDLRYDGTDLVPVWASQADAVVNCVSGNPRLPAHLALFCDRVIHPSTDAIAENTDYAAEKRQADEAPVIIIRAGIVDVARQPATAYTNWLCNPITPLEWAEAAWRLRDAPPGIRQFGREPLSRYDVARMVSEVFRTPPPTAARAPESNTRILASRANLPPLDAALREFREWLQS